MELIYSYVRDRQLFSRTEFERKHASAVVVSKKLLSAADGETQVVQLLDDALAAAARALRHEAHQYRVLKLAGTVSVGRAAENKLVLADESVSRLHGELRQEDGRIFVGDRASENGTWIIRASRKHRVEADEEVQDGDAVAWGNVRTQIFWPGSLFDFLTTLLDPRAAPGHE